MVDRGEVSWDSLAAPQQEEMDDVVAMLTEAAAQGHMMAQAYLADIYLELYTQAAHQGRSRVARAAPTQHRW